MTELDSIRPIALARTAPTEAADLDSGPPPVTVENGLWRELDSARLVSERMDSADGLRAPAVSSEGRDDRGIGIEEGADGADGVWREVAELTDGAAEGAVEESLEVSRSA